MTADMAVSERQCVPRAPAVHWPRLWDAGPAGGRCWPAGTSASRGSWRRLVLAGGGGGGRFAGPGPRAAEVGRSQGRAGWEGAAPRSGPGCGVSCCEGGSRGGRGRRLGGPGTWSQWPLGRGCNLGSSVQFLSGAWTRSASQHTPHPLRPATLPVCSPGPIPVPRPAPPSSITSSPRPSFVPPPAPFPVRWPARPSGPWWRCPPCSWLVGPGTGRSVPPATPRRPGPTGRALARGASGPEVLA